MNRKFNPLTAITARIFNKRRINKTKTYTCSVILMSHRLAIEGISDNSAKIPILETKWRPSQTLRQFTQQLCNECAENVVLQDYH